MKEKSKRSSFVGFTLVELVIVIAVIAILAAVLIPTFVGVIDSANNSADLQLTTNMNTVLSTNLDEDVAATAENIRKYLKDNGLEEIGTKNDDVVITYNKTTKQFERVNLKKTFGSGNENGIITVSAEEPKKILADNPYSIEDILDNEIIISTKGNDFAEAINKMRNIRSDEKMSDYRTNTFKKKLISATNKEASDLIDEILKTTLFIDDKGNPRHIYEGTPMIDDVKPTRIVFNEELKTFDLGVLESYEGMTVVLPDTLTEVTYEKGSGTFAVAESNFLFAGNTALLEEEIEDGVLAENLVSDMSTSDAKTAVSEMGATVARQIFYLGTTENKEEYKYTSITEALDIAAKSAKYSGKERKVIVTTTPADKETYDETIYIENNVTLSVPFYRSGDDKIFTGYGFSYPPAGEDHLEYLNPQFAVGEKSIVDDKLKGNDNYKIAKDYKQFEITLGDVIVKNGGKIEVGGVMSYPDQYYNGHTSGYYGQLNIGVGKTITVEGGGTIDVYGYIKGGNVEAKYDSASNLGSDIYAPFVVTDFAGGMNSAALFLGRQSPFLRYAMPNIQSVLTINYGAKLWAHCDLWASSMFNTTDQIVIGYAGDDEQANFTTKGLITLQNSDPNGKVICKYDGSKTLYVQDSISGNNKNNLCGDIGKTTVTIAGDVKTEALSFLGIASTDMVLFPVPFNFEFVIENGAEMQIYNQYVILPGAKVEVKDGGKLTVTENSTLYVMDYLQQGADMSGKKYPTYQELSANNFDTSATLTVDGTLEIMNGAKAGGIVRTSGAGTGKLIIHDADLSGVYNIGGVGNYAVNTSSYVSPLRIYDTALDLDSMPENIKNEYVSGENYKGVPVGKNMTYKADTKEATIRDDGKVHTLYVLTDDEKNPLNPSYYSGNKTTLPQATSIYGEKDVDSAISVKTYGFKQDDGEAKTQADTWNGKVDKVNDNFDDLAKLYGEYCSLGLLAKSKIGSEKLSTLTSKVQNAFEALYSGTFDAAAKTDKYSKAKRTYDKSDAAVKELLKDKAAAIDAFLNGTESVLFTVTQGNDVVKTVTKTGVEDTDNKSFAQAWSDYTGADNYTSPVTFKLYGNVTVAGDNKTGSTDPKNSTLILDGTKNQNVTIDLNEFELICYNTNQEISLNKLSSINVGSGATLKIENGSILSYYSTYSSEGGLYDAEYFVKGMEAIITSAGKLVMDDVTLNAGYKNKDYEQFGLDIFMKSTGIKISEGSAELNKVKISENAYCGIAVSGGTSLIVKNSEISAERYAVDIYKKNAIDDIKVTFTDTKLTTNGHTDDGALIENSALYVQYSARKNAETPVKAEFSITRCTFVSSNSTISANGSSVQMTLKGVEVIAENMAAERDLAGKQVYGIELNGGATMTLENCKIIASEVVPAQASAAVNVAEGSALNLVYDSQKNGGGNYFSAKSKESVFGGTGTVQIVDGEESSRAFEVDYLDDNDGEWYKFTDGDAGDFYAYYGLKLPASTPEV